ncbi:hypothetical protein FPOA_11652 [Fusarium poae]|uniref:Ecp2 effector protein domain-containing protein n=1 Tax=Fusarium poae TaxID=36050 RepID=A0A1B8AH93_FUSPO|nr:hypothetical protein FPOA_11652 [Fusarium poae]
MRLAFIFAAIGAAGVAIATDDSDSRYSSCWADRGYLSPDALIAGNILAQNNTFEKGTFLAKKDCIYHRHQSTMVSLCNGNARNRTVNRGEVRRGIDQLIKDCNIDEAGFSGIHVVNNLTFAAFGVNGGKNIKVPAGANPPDIPSGKKQAGPDGKRFVPAPFIRSRYRPRVPKSSTGNALQARQGIDPCATMGYDGVYKENCHKKEGHVIVDGVCPSPIYRHDCWSYCEQRRAGYLGLESRPEGQEGTQNLPAIKAVLSENTEYSNSHGFSIGVEGVFKEMFGAGVNYDFSTSVTYGKTVQQDSEEINDKDYWRWVYFPKWIETCGIASRYDFAPGPPNPNGGQSTPKCGDNVEETVENTCAFSPEIDSRTNQPIVFWAVRYEDKGGNPLPIDKQHKSYQKLCSSDPDGDSEQECAVEGEE